MTVDKKIDWLDKARKTAWDTFGRTSAPLKTVETWRRLPFSNWRMEHLEGGDTDPLSGVTEESRAAVAAMGGELMTLEQAASRYGDMVRPFLEAPSASSDFLKFESANLALWREGVFLHVPKGVEMKDPVHITFRHNPAQPYAFPRSLVHLEAGADATIVEEHVSAEGKPTHAPVSSAFSHITMAEGSHLRYFTSQDLSLESVHFSHQRIDLAAKARLEHYSVMLGARRHKSELQVVLGGEGAESEIRGVLLARGDQFFDPHTAQLHKTGRTHSNLLFRSAVRDRSRSIYTGLIRIEKDAPNCEAYQTNRNLMISEGARADSTPILEILPDAVKCQHGATAGPVNPEELFYLASRGIEEKEALRMLILGFFDPILSSFPVETLRKHLTEKVEREAVQ